MRKFVTIAIIVLIVGAIGVGVYFGLQKSKSIILPFNGGATSTLPIGTTSSQNGQSQTATNGEFTGGIATSTSADAQYFQQQKQQLSIFSSNPAVGYWITAPVSTKSTSTPSEQFYLNQKGEVIQILDINKEQTVSTANFGTPVWLKQNIDGSKVDVYFDSGTNAIFDTNTKVWTQLDNGILSVAFSPSGKSLAYLKPNGGNLSIYTRDLISAKKTVSLIATLAAQDFNLDWPDANKIFLVSKPSSKYFGEIWYFDLTKKTLNRYDSGNALSVIFSQPFNYGLKFISKDRQTMSVSIVDKSGTKLADMPFFSVFSKCVFALDAKVAYCAIPISFNSDSFTLPDDYLKGGLYTKDAIYKIDMTTSEISKIIDSETATIDAIDLKAVGNSLYFINRYDGLVYRFLMQ
jgi:hypothetical protein